MVESLDFVYYWAKVNSTSNRYKDMKTRKILTLNTCTSILSPLRTTCIHLSASNFGPCFEYTRIDPTQLFRYRVAFT